MDGITLCCDDDALTIKDREFTLTVKKVGEVHSLNTHEVNKILVYLEQKKINSKKEAFIKESILAFVDAQIESPLEFISFTNQEYGLYKFRLFTTRKNGETHVANKKHCEWVAKWLNEHDMQEHCDKKERIKIINHGAYICLRTKDIEPYRKVVPEDEYRQKLLEKNKLIALLNAQDGKDITSPALLQAPLQFHFERHTKK